MAHIVWSPTAFSDLDAALSYIAKDSPVAAKRMGERILARIRSLAANPELGSLVPEDERDQLREVFAGMFRVIYEVTEGPASVRIVTIIHAARLLRDFESDS